MHGIGASASQARLTVVRAGQWDMDVGYHDLIHNNIEKKAARSIGRYDERSKA